MFQQASETFSLPKIYFHWLETVRRFPMFDIKREGTLCSVRIVHILDLSPTERNLFAHRTRLRGLFPDSFLPLGYDLFGNLLLWDVEKGEVYMHWKGTSPESRVKISPSLEDFCKKLYYRPIQG